MTEPAISSEQMPWAIVTLLALWGFTVRLLLGREIATRDHMEQDIREIKDRIARIEGQLVSAAELARHWDHDAP
jgi:hypothetical protein